MRDSKDIRYMDGWIWIHKQSVYCFASVALLQSHSQIDGSFFWFAFFFFLKLDTGRPKLCGKLIVIAECTRKKKTQNVPNGLTVNTIHCAPHHIRYMYERRAINLDRMRLYCCHKIYFNCFASRCRAPRLIHIKNGEILN